MLSVYVLCRAEQIIKENADTTVAMKISFIFKVFQGALSTRQMVLQRSPTCTYIRAWFETGKFGKAVQSIMIGEANMYVQESKET